MVVLIRSSTTKTTLKSPQAVPAQILTSFPPYSYPVAYQSEGQQKQWPQQQQQQMEEYGFDSGTDTDTSSDDLENPETFADLAHLPAD